MQQTVFFSKAYRYSQARKAPRLQAEFVVEVLDGRPHVDRASDLSASGIGIRTTRPLRVMSLVMLRLRLPDGSPPLEVLGRVMWATGEGMGLRFEQAEPRITAFVNRAHRTH